MTLLRKIVIALLALALAGGVPFAGAAPTVDTGCSTTATHAAGGLVVCLRVT